MKWAKIAAAAVLLLPLAACDDTGPNISGVPGYSINSITVLPKELTIFIPDTVSDADLVPYEAVGFGKGGQVMTNLRFVWETSDESIATVDENGVVTPVRPGTVKIRASAYKIGEATLVILPATERVTLTPALDSIFVDEPIVASRDFMKLTATATDASGNALTGVAFTWQSAAANIASVDLDGTVRATALGTANVTATATGGASASASMRVVPIVASAQFSNAPSQVLAFDTLQMVAVARNYSNAVIPRKFNWTSSNPSVATVDTLGRVRFLTTGSTTITARSAFRSASTSIMSLERALISIDGGDDFTCGFTNLGRGYCWGLAADGQTGVEPDSSCYPGPSTCILPPKRMTEPQLSFTQISAGGNFACGITTDRLLYCWGSDGAGQIGNGGAGGGAQPQAATVKQERFTRVSAGNNHACAINLTGRVFCWGADNHGQLGDFRDINSTTPIPVSDSTLRFTSISAGGDHTCGITTTGSAHCWGRGEEGQIGNGGSVDQDAPTPVSGGLTFISIAAGGNHTCGVESSGSVYCWGSNSHGQLGIGGSSGQVNSPSPVFGGNSDFTAVTAGENHTCALGEQVRCWGSSEFGQVGDGNSSDHVVTTPLAVLGLTATSISAGANHTCALSTTGQAWCWGSNRYGALGNEFQAAIRAVPSLVARPR